MNIELRAVQVLSPKIGHVTLDEIETKIRNKYINHIKSKSCKQCQKNAVKQLYIKELLYYYQTGNEYVIKDGILLTPPKMRRTQFRDPDFISNMEETFFF